MKDKGFRPFAVDYGIKVAQGKLDELPGLLDSLPSDGRVTFKLKAFANLSTGKLQKARGYWLQWEPAWADPDQWHRLIRDDPSYACNYAGILMNTGDQELGKDLLRQAIHYFEEVLPKLVEDSHRWPRLGVCYLVEGSYEKALDFYEQRVEHGHISAMRTRTWVWWFANKEPWWDPVRDHPRYIAMEEKIEEMMAEQRELLRQMDEADAEAAVP